MADIIAGGADGAEEFDCAHDGNEGAHGDCDGKREEPDLSIGEENGVGDEDAKNRAGSANGGDVHRAMAPKHGKYFDENGDDSGAHSAQKKIIEEAFFAPD